MNNLAGWRVRGPVRTVRTEHAEWDSSSGIWKAPGGVALVTFRTDGRMSEGESHNPDGSVARWAILYDDSGRVIERQWWSNDQPKYRVLYSYNAAGQPTAAVQMSADGIRRETETYHYDNAGRRTKIEVLPATRPGFEMSYCVDGAEQSYGAPGATTLTTNYGEDDLPTEAIFADANGAVVRHIVVTRDSAGRPLSEVVRFGSTEFPFGGDVALEERRELAALLANAFADQAFSTTTYAYDDKGRLIERIRKMGALAEERTTFQYDDYDNPIAEDSEDTSREFHIDEAGEPQTKEEVPLIQRVRFEYEYDAHGNWTARVASIGVGLLLDFRRSSVERRTITYY